MRPPPASKPTTPAAIVHWNTTYFDQAVQHLRAQGVDIPEDLLAHVAQPLRAVPEVFTLRAAQRAVLIKRRGDAHFVESAHGAGQFGAAAQIGAVTQTVERAGPASIVGDQKGVEPQPLFARHVAGEGSPESAGGPGADASYQALARTGVCSDRLPCRRGH